MSITKEQLSRVHYKHFAAVALVGIPLSVWLLRQNNLHMVHLRDEVIVLDRQSSEQATKEKLEELGEYVLGHMNTDMGAPIELPGAYSRAVKRIQEKAASSGDINSDVYAKAQEVCEDPNVLLPVRAQCVQDYVSQNARPGTSVDQLEFPDKALYSHSFISPKWSFDFAGIVVLITAMSAVAAVALFIYELIAPIFSRMIENDPLE